MSVTTTYPGVYIEEDASPSISVSNMATATPVFIGQFKDKNGVSLPSGECILIENWLQFTTDYFYAPAVLAVTVDSNKDDSSSYSYTYNLKSTTPTYPSLQLQHYFQNGGGACYILPLNDPADTTELAALAEVIEQENDITLLVSAYMTTNERSNVYSNLLSLLGEGYNYFLIADSTDGSSPVELAANDKAAAYYPALVTTCKPQRPADTQISVSGYVDADNSSGTEITTLDELKGVNVDLYNQISADITSWLANDFTLPPCAAMAGIYCATDRARGVWKAPANVVVSAASGVKTLITDEQQGTMNNAGVNAIRYFTNRGLVVWGARTLAGTSTSSDTSWRYVPVRRLFNSAEADIKATMQTMIFEPNNQPTWQKVSSAIENYLYSLWRQGALMGSKPEEAYFVQIGLNVTMTQDDIEQGKMIVQVGMAAARPAEFIILQFTQDVAA